MFKLVTFAIVCSLILAASASSQQVEEPQGSAVCTLCNFVVNYVEKYLARNDTEAVIVAKLEKVCKIFGSFQPQVFVVHDTAAFPLTREYSFVAVPGIC